MKTITASQAAAALGRAKSPAKAKASRENGKSGGRPLTLTDAERRRLQAGEDIYIERRGVQIHVTLGDFGEYTFDRRFRSLSQAVHAALAAPAPTQDAIDTTLARAGWIKKPDGSYRQK
jgi:hypothetical protein